MVGRAHDVRVVLHHQDGVADVAQLVQDADQPSGVARMQPDGRLVEHVAGAHQARSQTSGELDALRLAAGERGREAVEGQVIEADVVQELEPLPDLDQDLLGDGGFFRRKLQRIEEGQRLGDVHAHDIVNVTLAYADRERLFAQARAAALGAQGVAPVAAQEYAHVQLVFLGFEVFEEVADGCEDRLLLLFGQVAEGHGQAHALAARGLAEVAQPGAMFGLGPRIHGAALEGARFVRDGQIHIEVDGVAEALASWACAERVVEAEQARLRFDEGEAALLAGELLAEAQGETGREACPTSGRFKDDLAGFAIADLDGIDHALAQLGTLLGGDGEAVDQHEHGFRKVDIEQRFGRGEFEDAARLKQPVEALLAQIEEMIAQRLRVGMGVRAYGKQRVPARAGGQGQQAPGHLIHRVALHARAAVGAKGAAHAGEQQPQEVVAFRGGGHRGARIPAGILLADGDGRRDAVDILHCGLFHALQELAGVGGKRLDVAALALGIDGVEGQRRFAGPGHTRDYSQLVVRERQRDILEIVDPRAANPDIFLQAYFSIAAEAKRGPVVFGQASLGMSPFSINAPAPL